MVVLHPGINHLGVAVNEEEAKLFTTKKGGLGNWTAKVKPNKNQVGLRGGWLVKESEVGGQEAYRSLR